MGITKAEITRFCNEVAREELADYFEENVNPRLACLLRAKRLPRNWASCADWKEAERLWLACSAPSSTVCDVLIALRVKYLWMKVVLRK